MVEVSYPDKNIVFEATLNFKNLQWTGEGVADDVYRSHRISLYPTSPISTGLTSLPSRETQQASKPAAYFGGQTEEALRPKPGQAPRAIRRRGLSRPIS